MGKILRKTCLFFILIFKGFLYSSDLKFEKINNFLSVENQFFKITINTLRGGRISSFIWKETGKDWVLPGNTGFFMDHVWQQVWPGELLEKKYEAEIVEKKEEYVVVKVWGIIDGKTDKSISGVKIIREMKIFRDKPVIEVKYILENPTEETKRPGLWVQNVIHVGGIEKQQVWTYRPTTTGVIPASYNPITNEVIRIERKDDFIYDPVCGWTGEIDPVNKEGIIFLMDYNWLRCLYNNGGAQSVEWWYDQATIPSGGSFETDIIMFPFKGLEKIDYACNDFIAELNMETKNEELILINRMVEGPYYNKEEIVVSFNLIDYKSGKILNQKDFYGIKLGKEPVEQQLIIKNLSLSTDLLFRVIVKTKEEVVIGFSKEKKTYTYELFKSKGVVLGTETKYRIKRPEKKQIIERPDVITKTPHEKFKILHIRGLYHYYYRIDNLCKVLDGEIRNSSYTTFVYGPGLTYFPADYKEIMSYDVIIINNVPIDAMDNLVKQYLIDYVENGGLLLFIGGHFAFGGGEYKETWLEELLPVKVKGPFDIKKINNGYLKPQPKGEKKIGVLWIHDLIPKKGSNIKIFAGKEPFWIECKYKKGIVVVLTGLCYGEGNKNMKLFWEWKNWSNYLAEKIKETIEKNKN